MYRAFTRVGLLATFDSPKSDIRTPSFPQIGSRTFGLLDTAPSSSNIGSPKVGLLVFQIDWESDIRTPSFADSKSECRNPSFSYIRSPTVGLLDTASENIIHFTDSSRIEKCNNTLHKNNPITVTIYAVQNNFYLLKLEFEISDFCSKIVRHLNASLLMTNANDQVNQ